MELFETSTGEKKQIDVTGVFIAIGHKPNTDIFTGKLDMKDGYLTIAGGLSGNATETSVKGVFAAGDVADHVYRQAVTSAGSGTHTHTHTQTHSPTHTPTYKCERNIRRMACEKPDMEARYVGW